MHHFRIGVFYKPPFCKRLGEESNEHKDYRRRCKDAERHILSAQVSGKLLKVDPAFICVRSAYDPMQ